MYIAHINQEDEIQTVSEHCIGTAQIASDMGKDSGLESTAYLMGILHDTGKMTKVFNEYIQEQHKGTSSKKRGDINHSSAGAKFLNQEVKRNNMYDQLACQLIAYAVSAHHGIYDVVNEHGEDRYSERISPQKEIYYDEAVGNYTAELLSKDKLNELFLEAVKEIHTFCDSIQQLCRTALQDGMEKKEAIQAKDFYLGCLQRYLLSFVIDADRIDTNRFMSTYVKEPHVDDIQRLWQNYSERLEQYISKFKMDNRIAVERSKISAECSQFAKVGTGIYRLSCPTGGGKTLASFRYAFSHALKYNKKHIYYIAPYRAILEQNCKVIQEVIGESDYILEHHSDVIPDDQETYQYLTQRWSPPIIITTLVQFLNTLVSNRTQCIRRFHNLSDSIIILDEVQNMPIACVNTFNQVMNFLSYCCNTTIILCTATQPLLDQIPNKILLTKPYEMIQNVTGKYQAFKRAEVLDCRITEGYSIEKLRGLIFQQLETSNSILVILNTKLVVKQCFQECQDYLKQSGNEAVVLFHISTNMCPRHRMDQLEQLQKLLGYKKVICISTQCLEAGVDLSFECVIRSFAGLDSIAQSAGRCNRHGEKESGQVLIVNCNDENLSRLPDIRIAQDATRLILDSYKEHPELFDQDLLSVKAMDKYYERYYFRRLNEMNYSIPALNTSVYDLLSNNLKWKLEYNHKSEQQYPYPIGQAFDTAGSKFRVIGSDTTGVLVPYGDGIRIIKELNSDMRNKDVSGELRSAQRFTVNLYSNMLHRLQEDGAIYEMNIGGILAVKDGFYDEVMGLQQEGYFDSLIL